MLRKRRRRRPPSASPYAYSQEQRIDPKRKAMRVVVPVTILAAMLIIPAASGRLSADLDTVRILAGDIKTLQDTFEEFREQQVSYRIANNGEIRQWPTELSDTIPDHLVWELKNDLYYSQNDAKIYSDFHQFLDALAHRNYEYIPHSMVDVLKSRVSPTLVDYIKRRLEEIKPSPEELKYVALKEGVAMGVISQGEARMLSVDNRAHAEIPHHEKWIKGDQEFKNRR